MQTVQSTRLSKLKVLAAVLFYTVTAIAAVIGNKHFLRSVYVPVTFLLLQLVVSSVLLSIGFGLAKIKSQSQQQQKEHSGNMSQLQILRILGPMILLNTLGLAFNIVCLHKIDSIMHQITRGLTLPLTALLGPVFNNDSGSWRVLLLCFFIFSGFIVAVSGEFGAAKISSFGVTAGIASSLVSALSVHVIKRSFTKDRFSALSLVFYNNVYSMLALLPLALAYEGLKVLHVTDWKNFGFAVAVTGVLGFLINYAGFIQIQVTSPVTHCVSCGTRGILQVAASCLILHEKISWTRATGLGISLLGSSVYPVIKSIENKKRRPAEKTQCYTSVESPTVVQEISAKEIEK